MESNEKIIKLIMGKRGSGKSWLAKNMLRKYTRLFVYDPMGEYTDGVIVDDFAELSSFWLKVYKGNFKIIYRPLDAEAEFPPICKLIWDCQNITFLTEEVQTFCNPRSICTEFKAIIAKGRHRDIEFIGVTQRPAEISKLLTSQAKEMYIFTSSEPNDLQYFKDSLGQELVDKIAELKEYEFVKWQQGKPLEISKA